MEITISPFVHLYLLRSIMQTSQSLACWGRLTWGGLHSQTSCSSRLKKPHVKILPLLQLKAKLARTSGVTASKHVNLSHCMQPSFTRVNLTRPRDPTNICIFSPVQICNTNHKNSLPQKAVSIPSSLWPQKRLLSDIQQLQTSGSLKIRSLTQRVLWDSGYSPVFSFALPREARENSDI